MDMEMDTDAMSRAMELMDTAGQNLGTEWGTVSDRLATLSGQLGAGELGAAYLSRYEQSATAAMAAVTHHCRQPGLLATTGHECAGLYMTADQNAAGAFDASSSAAPAGPEQPARND